MDRRKQYNPGLRWLLLSLMRLAVYTGLFLCFYLLMSINNWTLLHVSRTTAIVLLTWVTATFAMAGTYGGYKIGRQKNKPLLSSMSLAAFCTDLLTYLALQIMNTNANHNEHLMLFGPDFALLLVCMVLQFGFLVLMVSQGNRIFFLLTPAKNCLVVLGPDDSEEQIVAKIDRYRLQWSIAHIVHYDAPNVCRLVEEAEVVFLGKVPDQQRVQLCQLCYDLHKDVLCKANLQDVILANAQTVVVDDSPFLEMDYMKQSIGQRLIKRLMDITISGLLLLLLSPAMLLIALLIHAADHGPVFYRQRRATFNGQTFVIHKFRTMRIRQNDDVSARRNDDRITRIGLFLRRYRLDELPQLYNILRGDMSLVGPRPEMLENVERYKQILPSFVYREKMKAGLTGLAQIEGRYNTTPEDKLMLDMMYIESFSILLDVKLLFRTLTVLFRPDSTEGFDPPDDPSLSA